MSEAGASLCEQIGVVPGLHQTSPLFSWKGELVWLPRGLSEMRGPAFFCDRPCNSRMLLKFRR